MREHGGDPVRAPVGAPPGEPLVDDGAGAAALDRVLRGEDFRPRLAVEVRDMFRLAALFDHGVKGDVSRRFCLRLAEEAERLEYALLEVGARGNRQHAYFVEVVASIRWLARSLHALLHLRARIRRYLGEREDLAQFRRDADLCARWLVERLAAALAAAREEAEGPLGMATPREPFDPGHLRGEEVRWRLVQDVDAPESKDERERIVEAATAFLSIGEEVERAAGSMPPDDAALPEWARATGGPAAAHEWRVGMHTVQSTYDASVASTPLEGSDPDLKVFRGYVSIQLHLLETVAFLLQLHARLDVDVRSQWIRERTAKFVKGSDVLRWASRFGVAYSSVGFREAGAKAHGLIDRYTRRREATLDLPPGRKLHLRPAGLIVRVVQHHGLPVSMRMGEQEVDARQLMDVILLAASHPTATQVSFRGDERPLADLALLFRHRLGEEGLEGLPPELAYLREGSRPPAAR